MSDGPQRRLAAIVAIDVVGYSRLMGADELGTLARLKEHRAATDPIAEKHGGRIVGTAGDGVLLEFPSVVEAVGSAIEVQTLMAGRNAEQLDENKMLYRIGVHVGDVMVDGNDIFGDGVNIAARIEPMAKPGGVSISDDAYRQVRDRLDIGWEDGGEHKAKNIARTIQVWHWTADQARAPVKSISENEPLPLPDKPSIAVLPFDNMSGDPEQEYFSDGITEDIITALCRFRQLVVLARNTCFTYKGRSVDVKLIAGELGVRYVLEGSVRKAGNRVRITVQLIEGASGNHLWAERYDRDLEDIFGVQDEITQVVAGAIEPEITKAEFERVRRTPPSSLDAWSMYQHGMHHFQKYTQEDDEEARRFFRAAVALDPNFSAPHAIIARTYSRSIVTELPENLEEQCKLALEEAKIAVALDRDDAYAHASLGFAQLWTDADASIRAFEEALSINPNLAIAHFGIGLAFMSGRQPETAISHLETAIQLSPRDPMSDAFYFEMGTAYFALGDYEACLEWSSKSGFDISVYGRTGSVRMAALALLGRESEMKQIREILIKKYPHLTVSHVLKISPFLGADYVKGLRKAGLPEE